MRYSDRSDVRYCTQCGIGTGTDDRFCPNCGKELPERGESSPRPDTGQRRDERRSYRPGAGALQRPEVHVENKSGGFGSGFAQGCGCSVGLIVALLLGIVLLFMVCTVAIVT